ncbi:MAG: sporulation initiation inhibitor Soj [Candidatus Infernicultor aquiphilus]|uniref:Sporulation initiation inhibitor Soj n=1 Tax=Candidatus Infernicultor aquiphilus TaxID=1805029 RepID=A0A1J5G854_9BACT|nr:ParA family protein [bacterium]OIP68857.1 MAG: sporulation initiation inhibitor Soj [Candidatus Atribacteria bacterium CG2_30_33_13]PIW11281.1 MAG: sporulation initiation inhibitor Soj [Candidatus Atribacteria bacterium CG17_big_fil_post_rev_8_21_14_2_50_34_11]PIX34290.1 MAG: sporulation initiation inhibitor Soj [Candidatus Atribacteria bacterium CG_4_8_14_3_um_filter_34_18]PIY31973.1 MAG: sporulation initiation inhibitor Soj [Candidatus Atribacteria bacterium CG_4_10_14_3_um_filter_34_13]P
MRIISIANQKGGVAKTTTTINLGASLSSLGKKVLLIDLDPQAHTTLGLGIEPDNLSKTMLNVLEPYRSKDKLKLEEIIINLKVGGGENLFLAPTNIDFASAEYKLIDQIGREDFLGASIRECKIPFDYIIIDCPPSLGILTVNALKACNEVIIPMQPHYFALRGIQEFMETAEIVRRNLNHHLKINILITIAEIKNNLAQEVIAEIKQYFSDKLLKNIIRKNITLVEASSQGVPALYYSPNSHGAIDYYKLAQEVISFEKEEISAGI